MIRRARLWYHSGYFRRATRSCFGSRRVSPRAYRSFLITKSNRQWLPATCQSAQVSRKIVHRTRSVGLQRRGHSSRTFSWVKSFIASRPKGRHVVVLSAGSWMLVMGNLKAADKLDALKTKLTSCWTHAAASAYRSVVWVWRAPTPVDDDHNRFFNERQRKAARMGKWSLAEAKSGASFPWIRFRQWRSLHQERCGKQVPNEAAPARRHPHLLDEGRHAVAQLALNAISMT